MLLLVQTQCLQVTSSILLYLQVTTDVTTSPDPVPTGHKLILLYLQVTTDVTTSPDPVPTSPRLTYCAYKSPLMLLLVRTQYLQVPD